MKRYIKTSSDANYVLFKGIRLFNDAYDNHIYLNKDKTAFRYVTYERDFYEFGYVSDLASAFDKVLASGRYDVQSDKSLLSAFTDAFEMLEYEGLAEYSGAHHAFESSELNDWVKLKNREYGFNVLSDDEGYAAAQRVQNLIVELCDQYSIPVKDYRRSKFEKWGVTVKPKLRQVKFTGGYDGLAEHFLPQPKAYKKAFIQMLNDNTQNIVNEVGLTDMVVNDRTGTVVFHY